MRGIILATSILVKLLYIAILGLPLIGIILIWPEPSPVPTELENIDVGKVVDVRKIPTSWNESVASEVETDKGKFLVYGTPSIIKDEDAYISHMSDGNSYLCLTSWEKCRLISQ